MWEIEHIPIPFTSTNRIELVTSVIDYGSYVGNLDNTLSITFSDPYCFTLTFKGGTAPMFSNYLRLSTDY